MSFLPKRLVTLGIVAAAAIAGRGVGPAPQPPAPGEGVARPAEARAFGPIHPRLSVAGDRVVFSYQGAIWRLPRAGGVMTRLTDGAGFDIEPAWSPDGGRVAYLNTQAFAGGVLRVIRAEDGAPVPLPKEVAATEKLAFGPDGTRLLGKLGAPGTAPGLAWTALDTGEITPVRTGSLRPHRYALSHDGGLIAFTTTPDVPGQQTGNDGPEADLWTVKAGGGEPVKVVHFPARIHDLCWAAGDRALVVATELGGVHNDLWEVPLDEPERGARRLTSGQADEDRPSTSGDGRWLLYTDNRLGPTALVLRDLASGKEETLEVEGQDHRRPTGRLALGLVGASDRSPLVARVSVRSEGGKFHAPPGSLYRVLKGDLHFYADGRAAFDLPEGRYEATVARGPEYRVARVAFEVRPGTTTTQTVALERWTDQRARGWHSGESHIHANYGYGPWYNSPRTMLLQCAGEDLGVGNFMVANSDGDGVFDREHFRGRPDPLSDGRTVLYWNEEFRSTIWGHMTLLNLKHLVEPIDTGFLHTTHPDDVPTNADVADLTHDEGGHANYTHPAQNVNDPYLGAYTAKALPMDVALGKVDSVDVMGSNHEANLPLWYRLLNCGFRIPASAGTDCFLNRIPSRLPGSDRAYVKVEGAFSYEEWIKGLKAGRTFVTNGPMLGFTADGHDPGATIQVGAGAGVRVRGRVTSQYPLDRIEVIHNGRVVVEAKASGDRLSAEVEHVVNFERSGWVAARASGPFHRDQPNNGSVFGHTSAVYVEVAGRPADAREDAVYFLAWIDRLAGDIRRRDRVPSRSRAHVESQLAAARAVYQKMLATP
jgi:hypothetical protein